MYYALSKSPFTTAIAACAAARVAGSLRFGWLLGMASRIAPHPIDRVVSR